MEIQIQTPAWLDALYTEKFFVGCSFHESAKKNEKNICCLDCCISICPHCVPSHSFHTLLQVRRYVYHEVVRLDDLQKLIDCSNVQAYTINSAKVVFIKKRIQSRQFRGSGNYCTSCDRSLQEPFIHCSLGCKVEFALKNSNNLFPYLKRYKPMKLHNDFFIPNEEEEEEEVTPNATALDSDEPISWSSGSSGSETMSVGLRTKETSGFYVCSTRRKYKINDDYMASSMNRRKGVPHRSPLC